MRTLSDLADLLLFRTWWRYRPRDLPWVTLPYHAFNLVEGCFWITFAGLVLRRHLRHRRSPLELWYSLAFFTFGLTDFREAYALSSWLIWLKLINLAILFRLRSIAVTRLYPGSRLY